MSDPRRDANFVYFLILEAMSHAQTAHDTQIGAEALATALLQWRGVIREHDRLRQESGSSMVGLHAETLHERKP